MEINKFEELIDLKKWQNIQDTFSSIAEIYLRTVDPKGNAITSPSGEPSLYREFLLKTCATDQAPKTCLPTFLGGDSVVDNNLSYYCPRGLHNFIVPLALDENRVLAHVIVGPVILVARKEKDYYDRIADEFNFEREGFWKAIQEIRVLSFFRIQAIVELIKEIGNYVLELAFRKVNAADEISGMISKREPKFTQILDKFLNVAIYVSGADIGSIMMLDNASEGLTIRASKGLPEEIVKNTCVKCGESIAGKAVQENKCFIINDDCCSDNRIKGYLCRPQIRSSIILPIKLAGNTLGVMNLGATESSLRFSQEHVRSMNEFIDLADMALTTIK
jgi:putative methionine-R-sulfoxide reductase with GAF domain/ligand-binding sensor protein